MKHKNHFLSLFFFPNIDSLINLYVVWASGYSLLPSFQSNFTFVDDDGSFVETGVSSLVQIRGYMFQFHTPTNNQLSHECWQPQHHVPRHVLLQVNTFDSISTPIMHCTSTVLLHGPPVLQIFLWPGHILHQQRQPPFSKTFKFS